MYMAKLDGEAVQPTVLNYLLLFFFFYNHNSDINREETEAQRSSDRRGWLGAMPPDPCTASSRVPLAGF